MKPRYVYRSAISGHFVTAAYAKRYPKRTVRERVKIGPFIRRRGLKGRRR